jgi:hypothetical protein
VAQAVQGTPLVAHEMNMQIRHILPTRPIGHDPIVEQGVIGNQLLRHRKDVDEVWGILGGQFPNIFYIFFGLLSRDRKSSEQYTCFNRRDHEMKAE